MKGQVPPLGLYPPFGGTFFRNYTIFLRFLNKNFLNSFKKINFTISFRLSPGISASFWQEASE